MHRDVSELELTPARSRRWEARARYRWQEGQNRGAVHETRGSTQAGDGATRGGSIAAPHWEVPVRRHARRIRPKRPFIAAPDQVRITRDLDGANIEYAEESVSGVHLVLAQEEMARMTDEEILEIHNRCIAAQEASMVMHNWVAVEVPPGAPGKA